ncbi:MAG: SUMF1/EgtB/PvdO family nonheme iron enzyme [Spirochaetes bacterium]|nr:SUMF1/EgtB/PvdO family nonheme iron enzyme [Spirochaetota bacterium]
MKTTVLMMLCSVMLLPADDTMVRLPGGSFSMGSTLEYTEKPIRTVTLPPFMIGIHEVTYRQWKQTYDYALKRGYTFDNTGTDGGHFLDIEKHEDNEPVAGVSWFDAVKWCNAASEAEGLAPCYYTTAAKRDVYRKGAIQVSPAWVRWEANGYRLPTEAEWEYACRAGTTSRYYWGDSISGAHVWNYANCSGRTHPVGLKHPNAFGIYDMSGNTAEWCFDLYGFYAVKDIVHPKGALSGDYRVVRGGGIADQNNALRSASRNYLAPLTALYDNGFRIVRTVK